MPRHRPTERTRRSAVLTALATAAVTAVTASAMVPGAAPALADTSPTTLITADVLPGLAKVADLGPAPAAQQMRLVVSLDRPDPAGEQALLDAEHDPASPQFGHFLSAHDVAARFGVPPERLAATTAWLTGGGLHVVSVSTARDQITVTGTADAVEHLFATGLDTYTTPTPSGGAAGPPDGRFVANTTAPRVPSGLGVANVVGLNTLQRMRTPSDGPKLPAGTHQSQCAGATCTGGTTPSDLWSVYEQPPAITGQGQRVAIFGAGATAGVISDLRAFESRFGLRSIPVTVRHPAGDTDFSDDSGHLEWNIDTQASHGMAPGLDGLELYFGETLSDTDVAQVFSQFTDDESGPKQASASYGECEQVPVVSKVAGLPLLNPQPSPPVAQGLGNNLDATLIPVTRQAALEGKTIFSSTGDTGSSCPVATLPVVGAGNGLLNQGVPLTNSPATLPDVVGVGGTVLYTDGRGHRSREYGWPFGGGGSALITPAPSYQRGTPGLTLPCVTDPTAVCRGIPDVSAQSGDVTGNGYDIVGQGKFLDGGGGGTSLASPLWAGMWARIQSAAPAGSGLGFANYSLYRLGKDPASYARDFHDITPTDVRTGVPSANGVYPALPGWDYQTGWGVPRVAGLVCDLTRRCS